MLPSPHPHHRRFGAIAVSGIAALAVATVALRAPAALPQAVYWGAWVDGAPYGLGDAPWDMRALDRFEAAAGKDVAIVHFGQPWMADGNAQAFPVEAMRAAWQRRVIPMVDWSPWDIAANGNGPDQARFALARIVAGDFDALIRDWARAAARWGRPMFLRMAHEMNGDWYPWSEAVNGNRPGEYVQAWRHVRALFRQAGATNVTWVWSANTVYPGSIPLRRVFPGRAQVDWVAVDAYNFGLHPNQPGRWRSFAQLFAPTYRAMRRLDPAAPVMISEVASTEIGGSKPRWITQALTRMPREFPAVRAVVWFNWDADGFDWRIESSSAATRAFRRGIAAAAYTDGSCGGHRGTGRITPPAGC